MAPPLALTHSTHHRCHPNHHYPAHAHDHDRGCESAPSFWEGVSECSGPPKGRRTISSVNRQLSRAWRRKRGTSDEVTQELLLFAEGRRQAPLSDRSLPYSRLRNVDTNHHHLCKAPIVLNETRTDTVPSPSHSSIHQHSTPRVGLHPQEGVHM